MVMRNLLATLLVGASLVIVTSAALAQAGVPTASNWPALTAPVKADPVIAARIKAIMAKMSLEQKVGQVIQGDLGSVSPADVARYHLGSVLNGGSSDPAGKRFGTGADWLNEADRFYDASVRPSGNLPVIPIIWGSDAVHGHSNVIGATLFPHNIGLGAMRNPELMRQIGGVTAREMRVTGLDWTFAPTLAVVRDDRWGRTYEGYSENPEIVASYAGAFVEGLQGKIGAVDWLNGPHIVATAKHFIGDGGTINGKDTGDNLSSEAELRDIHAAGYVPALQAGAQTVMASFSSWQGAKMHGNSRMLTDVLKHQMGFGGFVVGDWNGHGQVVGCSPTHCPQSINAGLDMFMAPDSWKELWESTLANVKAGKIPMARLDDAVARILRVKLRAGLFEAGRPSSRPLGGQWSELGSPANRAIAREAVRQSLVLLKNENATLPIKAGATVLVAGDGANNFMKQSGGWTLSWQGTDLMPADFPGATSIGQALVDAAKAGGGSATISGDGSFAHKPDVAVVVFGEDPYAEFMGDVPDLLFRDKKDNLALLQRYQAAGIPTVAVFLSGRPLWVNQHINASDAFVAAWLPGSEGGGIADVLYGKADFRGRLSFSWPKRATQFDLNVGSPDYDPLFPYGYGLSYAHPATVGLLSTDSGIAINSDTPFGTWFSRGRVGTGLILATPGSGLQISAVDRSAQEDSRRVVWNGTGDGALAVTSTPPLDLARESNGQLAIELDARVDAIDATSVDVAMECGDKCGATINIAAALRSNAGKGWQTLSIPLSCFAKAGTNMQNVTVPLRLTTRGTLDMRFSRIALGTSGVGVVACAR
jgi:beta-glucosidase